MNLDHYDAFKKAAKLGLRTEAARNVRLFIESFVDDSERSAWTHAFLESGDYGHKVRHELFRDLLFPVLIEGYHARDSWSLYYLAKCIQNLVSEHTLWEKLEYITSYSLLKLCFETDPQFKDVQKVLLDETCRGLGFAIHEWPSGLCWDVCETEENLAFARRLDLEHKHEPFFIEVEEILAEAKLRYSTPQVPNGLSDKLAFE